MLSLAQAAKATGKSKPTISRAIKAGKLSAQRSSDASYRIDPAELARVFPLTGDSAGTMKQREPGDEPGVHVVALLAERDRLIEEKEARIRDQADVIEDLRRRLDSLTALLPAPREPEKPPASLRHRIGAWLRRQHGL